MRLVLNEMWSSVIARQLRGRGHDVLAATEHPHRYRGVPDHEFFLRAHEDGRAVVTDNIRDFSLVLTEWARRSDPHFGVVFALRPSFDRSRPGIAGDMTRALDALLRERTSDEPSSDVLFLRP